MTHIEGHRAVVPSVAQERGRPLWSVLVPTYNCARFLEDALASVLIQDPGPEKMEIIVVDDHSTRDHPEEVVRRVGRGRVQFVRQERNIGKVRNFETGLLLSRGKLVHQLHGDDRVAAGFYAAMESAFEAHPTAGAFFTESIYIDENGVAFGRTGRERESTGLIEGWLDLIVVEQRVQAPAIVLKRQVYETLGAFDRRLDMVEDWEMWIRVATQFEVGFVVETTADYRVSRGSTTDESIRDGSIFRHLRELTRVVNEYLPDEAINRLALRRRANLADYLTQLIPNLVANRRFGSVGRIAVHALGYRPSARTLYRLLHFVVRAGKYARQ